MDETAAGKDTMVQRVPAQLTLPDEVLAIAIARPVGKEMGGLYAELLVYRFGELAVQPSVIFRGTKDKIRIMVSSGDGYGVAIADNQIPRTGPKLPPFVGKAVTTIPHRDSDAQTLIIWRDQVVALDEFQGWARMVDVVRALWTVFCSAQNSA